MAKLGEYGDQLPTMTEQEVFNVAAIHLIEQGVRSGNSDGDCLYNGDGVCCAAAPFIKDYSPYMEGDSWSNLVDNFDKSDNCRTLIGNLQMIHDNNDPEDWKDQLQVLATKFNLDLPEILKEDQHNG